MKWYEAAAQRAHPQAICTLGFCYAKGHGVPKNEVLRFCGTCVIVWILSPVPDRPLLRDGS